MKSLKYYYLLFLLVSFCSCSKQILLEDTSLLSICDTATSTSIDIDTAVGYLDSFFDSGVLPETKAGQSKRYDVEKINVVKSSAFASTKSESITLPDSLFYIVPFDEGGYAILSADSRYPSPVVCVCEDGSCDENDFTNAFCILNSYDSESFTHIGDDMFSLELILASFINCFSEDVNTKSNEVDPGPAGIDGDGPAGITKYGPFLTSKWSQCKAGNTRVFNLLTPNNAPAGCTVIALAQIMMYNNFPNAVIFEDTICRMTSMLQVAPYTNPYYPGPDSCKVQAGVFAKGLGNSDNVNVTYGANEQEPTGGYADDVKRTLENYGYVNVTKRIGFGSHNISVASDEIVLGRPVYLDASRSNGSGHAFVLDGDLCLPVGQFFHINFGWNGAHDGYYAKGTFDTAQRYSTDNVIDSMIPSSSDNFNYTWNFRMITYGLPN